MSSALCIRCGAATATTPINGYSPRHCLPCAAVVVRRNRSIGRDCALTLPVGGLPPDEADALAATAGVLVVRQGEGA